jgi:glycogen debranching enzyme
VNRSARPTDQEYARYVLIASTYRDTGYQDDDLVSLPFCVVDPLFNALLVWSERALADIAGLAGEPAQHHLDRAAALSAAMHEQLYDNDLGSYVAVDARTGRSSRVRTVGGLAPLLLHDLPVRHRRALMSTLTGPSFLGNATARGVPSYDLTAADVDPYRYWRGPTWINTSWLLRAALLDAGAYALAQRVTDSMLDLVATAGFREYFHPWTGEGLGAADFSWSAALVLDILHDQAS